MTEERSLFLRLLHVFYNPNPLTFFTPPISPSLSCIFNLSLSVLASVHPHLNVTKSFPSYPDPIPPQATIYLTSFTTKLLEKVVPHSHSPSMPCHFASALPSTQTILYKSTSIHWFLNLMDIFSVFAFLYFSNLSDIMTTHFVLDTFLLLTSIIPYFPGSSILLSVPSQFPLRVLFLALPYN